jgi:PPM family protein phosphatase
MVVVADGMGGHNGGEIASELAVSLLKAAYAGRSVHELEAGVRAASRAIWDRAVGSPDLQGMGTTICAAGVTADNELGVVHVGDSRAYLWRDGGLQRLTRDHSVTSELLASGELTESQVADHPLRGYITRALGVAPDVEVSSGSLPAAAGDRLMVCSDGLWGAVPDDEIEQLMAASEDIESTADGLVKLAQARGSEDDVSVVVADVYAQA